MVEQSNIIEFSNLGSENKLFLYTIMIILNRPIIIEQYQRLRNITDYVICTDEASNRLFKLKEKEQYIIIIKYIDQNSFLTV